mmetsp:Transcript_95098/g.266273  ORF Transcript_95098/g.266273 Transcript_95098/m.266273 type:complete len:271 (+) Transcript_95098:1917-2729(+)
MQVAQRHCHLHAEGAREIPRQRLAAFGGERGTNELVQAHGSCVVHHQVDAVRCVEGCHGGSRVLMPRHMLHNTQLLVQGEQLADVLDAILLDHLDRNGSVILVLRLEHRAEGASAQLGLEGVAPDTSEAPLFPGRPLCNVGILGRDALQHGPRQGPHLIPPRYLQLPGSELLDLFDPLRGLRLDAVDLLAQPPSEYLDPVHRFQNAVPEERLMQVEHHDIIGAAADEGFLRPVLDRGQLRHGGKVVLHRGPVEGRNHHHQNGRHVGVPAK